MKRVIGWLRENSEIIAVICAWFVVTIDVFILHKKDEAFVWAMFGAITLRMKHLRDEIELLRSTVDELRGRVLRSTQKNAEDGS